MEYLNAFLCGGVLCAIGQILIDKTQLTPARILTGFGHLLAKGVRRAVDMDGWLGVLTGGLTAAAGGVAAAVFFAAVMAAVFKPSSKR